MRYNNKSVESGKRLGQTWQGTNIAVRNRFTFVLSIPIARAELCSRFLHTYINSLPRFCERYSIPIAVVPPSSVVYAGALASCPTLLSRLCGIMAQFVDL